MDLLKASEIAKVLSASFESKNDPVISAIKPLHEAGSSDLSFFAPTSKKQHAELFKLAVSSSAAAILTHKKYEEIIATQIVVENPLEALIEVSKLLYKKPKPAPGIHSSSVVESSANLHGSVRVGPFCYIGEGVVIEENSLIYPHSTIYAGVKIGKNCTIHSGAVLREDVIIGDNCLIQAGAVIGGDGFGYIPSKQGLKHIPHIGTVELEDGVDVGCNSTIDRATLGKTKIGAGSKIDNLVMIGHNVQTGRSCLLCGQVGISGSSTIGDHVTLGGQVGVADHVKVGSHVRAAGKSGITSSLESNQDVAGFPAIPAQDWRKSVSIFGKLPEIYRALKNSKYRLD